MPKHPRIGPEGGILVGGGGSTTFDAVLETTNSMTNHSCVVRKSGQNKTISSGLVAHFRAGKWLLDNELNIP